MDSEKLLGVEQHPSRDELNAFLTESCGRGVPMFQNAETREQAMHGLAYIQRQILSTSSYKVHIGQCNAAVSAIQWALDHFASEALATPENGLREALEDPGYCETSPGEWLVDDANFEPVTIIAAGNFYIGQNSADGDEVDQIVLTPEGARSLAGAILSALQHNTRERDDG